MSSGKIAWQEAAWIFLTSRLAILLISAVGVLRVQDPASADYWFSWRHWDVSQYIDVVVQGYSQLSNTAFFPLWPLLLRGTGMILGGSLDAYYIAGLVLANLFFYCSLVMFSRLLREHFDETVARHTLFYLAFSAYAIFFFVGYTESLFLLLSLATFWSLQSERYWLAGCCGFLAALTRSQGVLLLVPFAVVLLQRFWPRNGEQIDWRQLLRVSLPLALLPAGVGVFMLYLGMTRHDPLAFSAAETQIWHRHLTFPLWSLMLACQKFFQPPSLVNATDLLFTLGPLTILIAGWKRLPLHYALYALCMILFNMSYPQASIEPLTSAPRYMLVVFPVFIILGLWGKHPRVERVITTCLLPMFAMNILLYVNHIWIA